MKKTIRTGLKAIAAAVAVMFAVEGATPAYAQLQDGRLLEANTRVGGGGRNFTRPDNRIDPNRILYGQVGRGLRFQGDLGYTPPNQLQTSSIGRTIDDFTRSSAPAGLPEAPRAFFSPTRTTGAPAGFRLDPATGTYVAKPVAGETRSNALDLRVDTRIQQSNLLKSSANLNNPVNPSTPGANRPLNIAGAEDINSLRRQLQQARNNTSTSLATLREARSELIIAAPDASALKNPAVNAMLNANVNTNRAAGSTVGASANTGQGVRRQMLLPATKQSTTYAKLRKALADYEKSANSLDSATAAQKFSELQRLRNQAQQEGVDPTKTSITPHKTPTTPNTKTGDTKSGESKLRHGQVPITAPATPEKDLNKGGSDAKSGDEGFSLVPRKSTDTETTVPPKSSEVAAIDPKTDIKGTDANKGADATTKGSETTKTSVVKVKSLTDGVTKAGLKKLLADAEKHMLAGKYTTAYQTYDAALQVAPNNPLVALGRSIADLGGGYYARSESGLRTILKADPALLMGQYDLKAMYGEERLQQVIRDLKTAAAENTDDARPAILLAFICNNADLQDKAVAYLELAQKRGAENDQLVQLMLKHWKR